VTRIDLATLADAAGIPSGTSFPGSPANNDLFRRTDLDLVYFYDGTRWLTLNLYVTPLPSSDALMPLSATNTGWRVMAPWAGVYDVWLEHFQAHFYVVAGTALGASHKWRIDLKKQPADTIPATFDIASGASSTHRNSGQVAIGALLGTTNFELEVLATKTGTPGNLYLTPTVTYRIVGT
jgi:hypothetical protein